MSEGAIDERVLLARQPIPDRDERVIAYELLYRPIPIGGGPLDPVAATASVIVNGLSDVGLDALVGPHPAYVNVTREFLLGVPSLPLAPERVVLELLEDQELDGALLDALRTLVDAGFTIALDDFQYSPEQEPLLELATIAKLDVRALSPERLAHDAALLKGRGLRLVAEKVETTKRPRTARHSASTPSRATTSPGRRSSTDARCRRRRSRRSAACSRPAPRSTSTSSRRSSSATSASASGCCA